MNQTDWDLIASYGGLLSLASVSIFAGAFGSLPSSAEKPPHGEKKKSLLVPEDEDEDEDSPDRLSSSDAWLFPILASVALFGTYLVVKWFGNEWLNWLLGWYFSLVGAGSLWKSAVSLFRSAVGKGRWRRFDRIHLLALKGPSEVFSLSLRMPTLLLLPACMVPSILYVRSETSRKSILLTDLLALSLSHNAISIMKLDSFKTGCILLSGLFIYDIYWVFGTKVMVEVATSLDVPIKILWPKSLLFTTERGATMLGLGDIVVPGIFVALALRYDYARSAKTKGPFTKPYFLVTLTSYVAGLLTTMAVMHTSGRAQPALLYLSPACMFSFLVTAFIRGEFRDAWDWSDDPEKKQAKACLAVETASGQREPTTTGENADALSQVPNEDARGESEAERGGDEERSKSSVETRTRKRKGGKGNTSQ